MKKILINIYDHAKKYSNFLITVFLGINLVFILSIHYQSIWMFLITFVVIVFLAKLILKRVNITKILLLYNFYVFMVLLVYQANKIFMLGSLGFNRAVGRPIGSDDWYFFNRALSFIGIESEKYNYVILLQIPKKFAFYDIHLIDFLIFNIIPLVLIPLIMVPISKYIFNDMKLVNLSAILVAVCPIILRHGVILLRDIWIVLGFVLLMYAVFHKRILLLFLAFVLVYSMRAESIIPLLLLLITVLFMKYLVTHNKRIKDYNIFYAFITVMLVVVFFNVLEIMGLSVFREEFTDSLKQGNSQDGTFLLIQSFPFIVRSILNVIWFFIFPLFIIPSIFSYGYFHPIGVLEVIGGFVNIFYIRYFIRGVIEAFIRENNKITILSVSYILFLLVIAIGSLQYRHTTMFQPIMLIIIVYGLCNYSKKSNLVSNIVLFFYLLVITIYNIIILF